MVESRYTAINWDINVSISNDTTQKKKKKKQ